MIMKLILLSLLTFHLEGQAKVLNFGRSKESWLQPKFRHDESACIYRFHDFPFNSMKKVTLTDEKHFQGRANCSVEFFNVPKGVIKISVAGKFQQGESCENVSDEVPTINVFDVSKRDDQNRTEIGLFCQTEQDPEETETISANLVQKLRFDFWLPTNSVEIQFKPYRVNIRRLYDEKESSPKVARAWLMSEYGSQRPGSSSSSSSSTTWPPPPLMPEEENAFFSSALEDVNIDFLYPDECRAQGRFVCQESVKCADEDGDYFVCRNKKFLCLNSSLICNGTPDCLSNDVSDELYCGKEYLEELGFIASALFFSLAFFIGLLYYKISKMREKNGSSSPVQELEMDIKQTSQPEVQQQPEENNLLPKNPQNQSQQIPEENDVLFPKHSIEK